MDQHVSIFHIVTVQKQYWSVQLSSIAQPCPTLCDPMPGLLVYYQLPESIQTHVHVVSDAIQPSHPLSAPSPPALKSFPVSGSFPMNQLFTWGGPSIKSFSFSISPSNEHPGLISFWMDWLDLLAVPGALKSLLQQHSSKASILWHSAFFIVQLSHPYMNTGKTIALTRWTFVDKCLSFSICCLGWS